MRIGELSRELEKAQHGGAGGGSKFRPFGTSKAKTLAAAGIPISTAHDYEQLTGGRDGQAQKVAFNAAEHYFAEQKLNQELPTMGVRRESRILFWLCHLIYEPSSIVLD